MSGQYQVEEQDMAVEHHEMVGSVVGSDKCWTVSIFSSREVCIFKCNHYFFNLITYLFLMTLS